MLTEVVEPVRLKTCDGQAEQHHVAADLGQDLGQEQRHEARVGEDPSGVAEVAALDRDRVRDLLADPVRLAQCSVVPVKEKLPIRRAGTTAVPRNPSTAIRSALTASTASRASR